MMGGGGGELFSNMSGANAGGPLSAAPGAYPTTDSFNGGGGGFGGPSSYAAGQYQQPQQQQQQQQTMGFGGDVMGSFGGLGGRGIHSFPFPLNLSGLCPPCNLSLPMDVSRRCSS